LPELNSRIRYCDDDCSNPSNILHKFPTRKHPEPKATAIVDLLDDDDNLILIATAQEDMTPAPTFLQEWEAFYLEFQQSTTYALATSSAASLLPSLIDDDDADDDRKTHKCAINQQPTNSPTGLRWLRHAVRELEKVNLQFANFVESLDTIEPCQPTLRTTEHLPHPRPDFEPQRDDPPKYPPMEQPPAPNLVSQIQHPTQQPDPPPHCDDAPEVVPTMAPPPAPNLPPSLIQNPTTQQSSMPNNRYRTIPTWAQPAVTTPALAGIPCMSQKLPPRPAKKPLPFKKKTPTKPHAANQKDFLRPP